MKKLLLNSNNGIIRLIVSALLGVPISFLLCVLLASVSLIPGILISVPIVVFLAIVGNILVDMFWVKYIHD